MKKTLLLSSLLFFLCQLSIAQNWVLDLDEAKSRAFKENKTIILVFQGSDWCAPCMKLDREIWSTETFKSYAAEHYIMLQADFPRRKQNQLPEDQQKANALLAEKYNTKGYFPYVVVLDASGAILGSTGYKKLSPEEYIKLLNTFISK